MKNFPALFVAEKDKKTGASPVWILKIRAGGVDYYLSGNAINVTPWGITTKRWVQSWGTITEGISGAIDEFKISDFSVSLLVDPDASPNILDLAETYDLEKDPCSLYLWFQGCADSPQEMFRGYIRDYPISDGDTVVSLQIQDETLKWESVYVGRKVALQEFPYADPDDVGKVIPIVYGTVGKLPALAVNAGAQTSLPNGVNATTPSVIVSDVSRLAAGKIIRVDAEEMLIQSIAGSTLTVVRGVNGTLAEVHQRGATVWEKKAEFIYVVADHPVTSMPKVYVQVGQVEMDVSALCTAWPAGDHPSYLGRAILSVPGYITVEQAVGLAVFDNIIVDSNLSVGLTGNVTKTGSVALAGDVIKTGSAAISGTLERTGAAVLAGALGRTGSAALIGLLERTGAAAMAGTVSVSGFVELIGSLSDPGHTHITGQSQSENATTGLPTPYTVLWDTYITYSGYAYRVQGTYVDFPADGARSDASYSITIKVDLSVASLSSIRIFASVDGATYKYYYETGTFSDQGTFSFSFSAGSSSSNRVYVGVYQSGYLNGVSVTAASRTIQLTGLVSGVNSAPVTKGSLAAVNGTLDINNLLYVNDQIDLNNTLDVSDTIDLDNTLDVSDTIGLNNTLGVSDTIGLNNTLGVSDTTQVASTLDTFLEGLVTKVGSVTLSGNSVANTLVGDAIYVDVSRDLTAPAAVVGDLLATWCGVAPCQLIGNLPASYTFNGAITEYRRAMDIIHDLAWQCRTYFRYSLGSAVLTVRELNPASIKTLAVCRAEGGKKIHSRDKSPYEEIINSISLLYGRDWTQDKSEKAYTAVSKATDQDSIDKYGERERPDLFQCDFITSQTMADDVRTFYLAFYAVRHWIHTSETYYFDSELEFMDAVTLGFSKNQVGQVSEVSFNPGSDTVQVKAIQ